MRWRAVLLARPLAHTPYFAVARWCVSPYLFFALQTQKIPERAAGGPVLLCGRFRRGWGGIGLGRAAPPGRFAKNLLGAGGTGLGKKKTPFAPDSGTISARRVTP